MGRVRHASLEYASTGNEKGRIRDMSWLLSITSAVMIWKMGDKSKYAPIIGIANQVLWIIYVLSIKEYGLLPGVILYMIVHVRNAMLWK